MTYRCPFCDKDIRFNALCGLIASVILTHTVARTGEGRFQCPLRAHRQCHINHHLSKTAVNAFQCPLRAHRQCHGVVARNLTGSNMFQCPLRAHRQCHTRVRWRWTTSAPSFNALCGLIASVMHRGGEPARQRARFNALCGLIASVIACGRRPCPVPKTCPFARTCDNAPQTASHRGWFPGIAALIFPTLMR